jgi:hypothetical protein
MLMARRLNLEASNIERQWQLNATSEDSTQHLDRSRALVVGLLGCASPTTLQEDAPNLTPDDSCLFKSVSPRILDKII